MARRLKDYDESYFENLTVGGIILRVIGLVIVLSLITSVVGWGLGWFNAGKDIVGPQNAKVQSYQVRDKWQAMITDAQNACTATQSAKRDPNTSPQLVEDPAQAYAALYRNARSEFNRLQQNPFENGITHYGGYPTYVRIFPTENTPTPDWCSVANELENLQ